MPMCIVDLLEEVEVNDKERYRLVFPPRAPREAFRLREKSSTIQETSERVAVAFFLNGQYQLFQLVSAEMFQVSEFETAPE